MSDFLTWLFTPADDAWFGAFVGIFFMWVAMTVILVVTGRKR